MNSTQLSAAALESRTQGIPCDLRVLFDEYFDYVWRLLRRLGVRPEEADDAAQEVFSVAARHLEAIEPGKERAYLTGTALRVASQHRRTLRRRREELAEPATFEVRGDTAPGPEELTGLLRARAILDSAMDQMPPEVRVAFVSFELEGMSLPEVADMLQVPLGTVKSRVRRARELFEEHLEQYRSLPNGKGGRP